MDSTVEVGKDDLGVDQGGCGCLDFGSDLLGGGTVSHSLRVRDVCRDTAHWDSLGVSHHRVDRKLTGGKPRRGLYGVEVYPLLEDLMSEAGLQEVDTYVSRRQKRVSQFIVTGLLWTCV